MAKKRPKVVQIGDDDHTADPRGGTRKKQFEKQNKKWNTDFESTKIDIPNDVLVGFTEMYTKYQGGKIYNDSENIQRVPLLNMDEHFKSLRNSKLTFVKNFYEAFTKAVGQHEFIVKGYLTWSLNHKFEHPADVVMYPDKQSGVSVSPLKVCFFSVDPMHDYYLQVWKRSITTSKTLLCPELVRVKHTTVRVFPGNTIYEGGFLNRNSNENYRIQLHVYSKFHSGTNTNNHFYNGYNYNNVTADQLNLYNFDEETKHVVRV